MKIDEIKDMLLSDLREMKAPEDSVDSLLADYNDVKANGAAPEIITLGAVRVAMHLLSSDYARDELYACGDWMLAGELLQTAAGCGFFDENPEVLEELFRLSIYSRMIHFEYGAYIEKVLVSVDLFRCVNEIQGKSIDIFEGGDIMLQVINYLAQWIMPLQGRCHFLSDNELAFIEDVKNMMAKYGVEADHTVSLDALRDV